MIDRRDGTFHRFERVTGGAAIAPEQIMAARGQADAERRRGVGGRRGGARARRRGRQRVRRRARSRAASCIPLLFGSAAWNFGVGLLLDALRELAPPGPARARPTTARLRPVDAPFAALVFKVQANMDPRHRDRVAFVRICSGRFERGMRVDNARTGRSLALSYAHEVFGQERAVLDEAFPGDVVGVVIGGDVRVGDTLYVGPRGALPADPDADAGVLRDDLQPRRQPPQAVPPRPRAARPGGRRPRPAARAHPGPGARARRASARCSSRSPSSACGPSSAPTCSTQLLPWTAARRTDAEGAAKVLADAGRTDVFVRGDGTQLAVFPNRFVLERFAQRNPTVRLERLIGADEPER